MILRGASLLRLKILIFLGRTTEVSLLELVKRFDHIFQDLAGLTSAEQNSKTGVNFAQVVKFSQSELTSTAQTELRWLAISVNAGDQGLHPLSLFEQAKTREGEYSHPTDTSFNPTF
jgi:hypothetical protein